MGEACEWLLNGLLGGEGEGKIKNKNKNLIRKKEAM